MSKYLLDQWDAIELFCRVVSKHQNIPLEKFEDNDFLLETLKDYGRGEHHELLSKKISEEYRKKIREEAKEIRIRQSGKREEKSRIPDMVRMIYDLSNKIRKSEPVVFESYHLEACKHYINNTEFSNKYRAKLKAFDPSPRLRKFENTKWRLYFYDGYKDHKITPAKLIQGVSVGIVSFNMFGNVTYERFKTGLSEMRMYVGTYRIYGEDNYLALKLKLEGIQRDLRLLFLSEIKAILTSQLVWQQMQANLFGPGR
jgi:antitoxin component of RelBE/YafQ-DinJ toxin-antitoxin module